MHVLGGVRVGGPAPVRIMGVINASPESFMRGSVATTAESIAERAALMEREGADLIDIGGMSTAPHIGAAVPQATEIRRVALAVKAVRGASSLPVSVDTPRAVVAAAALKAGAVILNDITGLRHDPGMAEVIGRHGPALILCAHSPEPVRGDPVSRTRELLQESVGMAIGAGADPGAISVDPAVGFFRRRGRAFFTGTGSDWADRDVTILQNLQVIKGEMPATVSVSNKSFIGRLMGAPDPADRLPGSLAFESMAVLRGADIVRTHNVAPTLDAVRTAERMLRRAGRTAP